MMTHHGRLRAPVLLLLGATVALPQATINVKNYGAKCDGSTDDATAITNAFNAAGSKYSVFFPGGTCATSKTITVSGGSAALGLVISGEGPTRSIIKNTSGGTVLEFTGPGFHSLTVRDIGLTNGGGPGHGIYIHDTAYDPDQLKFEHVRVEGVGGKGIYNTSTGQIYTVLFEGVNINNTGDNAFDIWGGNTVTFINTYVENVPPGRVGYRVHVGRLLMLSANGVSSGDTWGLFGDTQAEDGDTAYVIAQLINCNVESFNVMGVRAKAGSDVYLEGTTFIGGTGSNMVALQADSVAFPSVSTFEYAKAGGSWKNGQPIHVVNGNPPFLQRGGSAGAGYMFFDDASGTTGTGPNLNMSGNSLDISNMKTWSLTAPNLKANSGTRYVCVNTAGKLVSQSSPCSGT